MVELLVCLLFWAIAGTAYTLAGQFPELTMAEGMGAGFFPRVLAALVGVMSVGALIMVIQRGAYRQSFVWSKIWLPSLFLIIVCAYVLVISSLGFALATFLFLLIAMKLMKVSWKQTLLYSPVLTGMVYLVFHIIMRVPLPPGTIWSG